MGTKNILLKYVFLWTKYSFYSIIQHSFYEGEIIVKKRRDYISDIYYSMNISKVTFNKYLKNILTKRQFEIFKMRFDKDGKIKMTSEEIADQLGTTRQAVDGILNKVYASIIILCRRLNILVDVDKKIDRPKEYNISDVRDKTKELLLSIKTLKRLPKEKNLNNNISERVFSDGTDQRRYYNALISDVRKIKLKIENGIELSRIETQKLFDYYEVMKELSNYKIVRQKPLIRTVNYPVQIRDLRNKTNVFIKDLNQTHKLPESKYADFFNTGEKFEDGSDKRNFYSSLRHKAKYAKERFNKGDNISSLDKEKIISLKLIDNVLSFYPSRFYENKLMLLELINSLGLNIEKNKLLLSKYYGEVYAKVRFLIENNIPVVDENGVVNQIMFMNDEELHDIYNTSLLEITDKYVNGIINSELSEEVIKKLCKK